MVKVLIASDSHDNWRRLEQAVAIGNEQKCDALLFAGDLISPPGVDILAKFGNEVHMVLGNNEGELVKLTRLADAAPQVTLHGNLNGGTMELELGGLRFFMNHYPKTAELAALSGKYDVVVFGHTHTNTMKTTWRTEHSFSIRVKSKDTEQAPRVLSSLTPKLAARSASTSPKEAVNEKTC
jgi:putative phosphoesterase